jgi:NADPH:quinone reductase-like Zn-dependent oxidoreductase
LKAVRLYEYGGPENLKFEVDAPDPVLSADFVLIESAAASVNPIDWKIRSGARQKDFPRTLPTILGKDVSGVVRAVGGNIRTFKPGERVLAVAEATYAELVVVEGSLLTHLPEGLDLVEAVGSCSTRADRHCRRRAWQRRPRRCAHREKARCARDCRGSWPPIAGSAGTWRRGYRGHR